MLTTACASCIKNYGSVLWTMTQCCASMAHWYASGISMTQCYASSKIMAQCCASGINVAVHHASIWLNAVHPRLNDVHQASLRLDVCGASMTQAVHHTSIWLIVNTAWHIALNLHVPHHTLSISFFTTSFAINTWRRKKSRFIVVQLLIQPLELPLWFHAIHIIHRNSLTIHPK